VAHQGAKKGLSCDGDWRVDLGGGPAVPPLCGDAMEPWR
jgi:hypothetical protein